MKERKNTYLVERNKGYYIKEMNEKKNETEWINEIN